MKWARYLPGANIRARRRQWRKLEQSDLSRINFGCGPHVLPGWTNIDGGDGKIWNPPTHPDVINLDVWDALGKIPDAVGSYIASEQFFEHFDRNEGHRLLQEWRRILAPGGVVRIQAPDLEKEVRIYLDLEPEVDWESTVLPHRRRHVANSPDPYCRLIDGERYTRAMLLNNGMHMDGHRFLYDFETLRQSLHLAGFQNIQRVRFGESEHSELHGIDRHDGGPTGRHWIPNIVLSVEATRA